MSEGGDLYRTRIEDGERIAVRGLRGRSLGRRASVTLEKGVVHGLPPGEAFFLEDDAASLPILITTPDRPDEGGPYRGG